MIASNIVGAGGKRRALDFYPTPRECTVALMDYLKLPKHTRIYDPACGDGAILDALKGEGYENCAGSDIQEGVDFLLSSAVRNVDWLITNPPFSLAEQFIRHAHELGVPFAFLLKIQYWNSAKRRSLFEEITPRYVLPLTWRPDFTGQGSSLMDMMWCVYYPGVNNTALFRPLGKPKEKRG